MKNEQDKAYFVFCQTLDALGASITLGCNMLRAVTCMRGHGDAFHDWRDWTHDSAQQAVALAPHPVDVLNNRAQRMLARYVDPGADFFTLSPFENWETFGEGDAAR